MSSLRRIGCTVLEMPNRKYLTPRSGGHNIKIKGRVVNIHLARIVYRCEVCHAELKRHNKGLRCQANPAHRGFVHQSRVREIEQAQAANIEQLETVYQIVDGKVVLK